MSSVATATKAAPFINSLGMKFVPVSGTQVLFSIWETRVQDYEAFAAATGTMPTLERRRPKFTQGPTHPIVEVSWVDAGAFCVWLTERERAAGRLGPAEHYRLPSDHEWSCAVGLGRHEDGTLPPEAKDERLLHIFPWGTLWPPPVGAGNFAGEELRDLIGKPPFAELPAFIAGYRDDFPATAPVGSFPANALGLHDLSGNAYEWVQDQWKGEPKRVVRGGSWVDPHQRGLYSARRADGVPETRFGHYGFRVVLAPTK